MDRWFCDLGKCPMFLFMLWYQTHLVNELICEGGHEADKQHCEVQLVIVAAAAVPPPRGVFQQLVQFYQYVKQEPRGQTNTSVPNFSSTTVTSMLFSGLFYIPPPKL